MTRTPLLLVPLVAAALLTGCGGDTGTTSAAPAATGAADDGRVVVALDDFAALTILSLGVTPDVVFEAFEYDTTSAIFDDLGLETRPYGSELDLEEVIATGPDLVIGVSLPTTVAQEADLAEVAPTTILDYAAGWQEQLDATAAALGRQDEAVALRTRLAGDLETLGADLAAAGLAGTVVSVVGSNAGTFSPPPDTALGSLLADAGLERPAAQQRTTTPPFVAFSPETLRDHDGEALFLLGGGAYDPAALTGSPLWPQLGAVSRDAVHEVDGETWLGPSAFSVDWVIRDVRATLVDGGSAAVGSDAPTRFADFVDG